MLGKSLLFGLLINLAFGAPAPSPFFSILTNALKDSANTVSGGYTQLSTPVTAAVTGIPESISKTAGAVKSGVGTLYTSGKTAASTTLDASANLIGTGIKVPSTFLANKLAFVGSLISNANTIGKTALDGTLGIGKAAIGAIGTGTEKAAKLGAAGLGVVEGGLKGVMAFGNAANKIAINTSNKIGTTVDSGIKNGSNKIAEIVTDTSSTVNGVADKIATTTTDLTDKAVTAISDVATDSAKTTSDLTSAAIDKAAAAADSTTTAVADATKTAVSNTGTAIEGGLSTAASLGTKAVETGQTAAKEANSAVQTVTNTATEAAKSSTTTAST